MRRSIYISSRITKRRAEDDACRAHCSRQRAGHSGSRLSRLADKLTLFCFVMAPASPFSVAMQGALQHMDEVELQHWMRVACCRATAVAIAAVQQSLDAFSRNSCRQHSRFQVRALCQLIAFWAVLGANLSGSHTINWVPQSYKNREPRCYFDVVIRIFEFDIHSYCGFSLVPYFESLSFCEPASYFKMHACFRRRNYRTKRVPHIAVLAHELFESRDSGI